MAFENKRERTAFMSIVSHNKTGLASPLSTKPVLFGKSIVDLLWIVIIVLGIWMIYSGYRGASLGAGGMETLAMVFTGFFMVITAYFMISNTLEEEASLFITAVAIICIFVLANGAAQNRQLIEQLQRDATDKLTANAEKTFSYRAILPQMPQATSTTTVSPQSCQWYNTRTSAFLTGEQAAWCKDAVENKLKGYELCECRTK